MKFIQPKPFSPEYVGARGAMIIASEDEIRRLFEYFAKGDRVSLDAAEALIGVEILHQLQMRTFQIMTPHAASNINAELYGCPIIADRRRGDRRQGERRHDP